MSERVPHKDLNSEDRLQHQKVFRALKKITKNPEFPGKFWEVSENDESNDIIELESMELGMSITYMGRYRTNTGVPEITFDYDSAHYDLDCFYYTTISYKVFKQNPIGHFTNFIQGAREYERLIKEKSGHSYGKNTKTDIQGGV